MLIGSGMMTTMHSFYIPIRRHEYHDFLYKIDEYRLSANERKQLNTLNDEKTKFINKTFVFFEDNKWKITI